MVMVVVAPALPAVSHASVHLLQQKVFSDDTVHLFVENYLSYADFANGLIDSTTLLSRGEAGPGYSITGLTFDFDRGQADSGSATAVPEPASWGLMILGFGLAGAAARRLRARAAKLLAADVRRSGSLQSPLLAQGGRRRTSRGRPSCRQSSARATRRRSEADFGGR
jgi:hypothetical protein